MNTSIFCASFLSLLALIACSDSKQDSPTPAADAGKTSTPKAAPLLVKTIATPEVHHAICGHALPAVAHCGNYVELDGQFIEIIWPQLGVMEWCKEGKKGADIEITGAMEDGKFVATSLKPATGKE